MQIVNRIDHVVTLVRDLDAAFETYTQRLGFPISWEKSRGAEWQSAAVWLGNASMELLQPNSDGGSAASFFAHALETRGEGLFLVAFEPCGLDNAIPELRRRDVPVAD